MASKLNNCFLINAPAGSGKTTRIKEKIFQCISCNPKDNILCITYTNRAAEELSKSINAKNVFIGTIHSFLHNFMSRYFSHSDILALYFEIYGERIKQRIENAQNDEHITESNNRYIEKFGQLDFETIKENISIISYNESPFSSLYYGGLSHDDLIAFSMRIFERYPIVQKRISLKYQFIFIDEYQDTMADVLKIFYNSVASTKSELYLFGDRMQQIYKNYDGSFEEQFETFDTTTFLSINYRSNAYIVSILNRIYNDPEIVQSISSKSGAFNPAFLPRVIITDDVQTAIQNARESAPDTLILYLLNKDRFSEIDSIRLYLAYDGMEKYSFGKTYTAVDVLTTPFDDNPDPLMKLLYCIANIAEFYYKQQYGLIIQTLKANTSMFCKNSWYIEKHSDKQRLFDNIKEVIFLFEAEDKTIDDLLSLMESLTLINESYLESIRTEADYKMVFSVPVIEVVRVHEYLNNPWVSTQHGVKGESHNSVVFVADDNYNNPTVHMYRFFDMWSQIPIDLKSFNSFYYAYSDKLFELQTSIGTQISSLNKDTYTKFENILLEYANAILCQFNGNPYFDYLCKEKYNNYITKPGVTKAKDCFKGNTVYGVLSAYKLFYVGCSRARNNLTIILDKGKIKGNLKMQANRFTELGFEVNF